MTAVRSIRDWLVEALAGVRGVQPEEIDPAASFHDQGIGSSETISLCGELAEWLGSPVSPAMLYEYPTIDGLAAALAGDAPDPAEAVAAAEPGRDRVCVVGIGCRFPGGADTPERFWRNLSAGVHAAVDVPTDRWDAASYFDPDPAARQKAYTTRGGFLADIAGFDADFFGISAAEALRMEPQQRLLLEVTWAALEDAGIAPDRLRGSRTGVFVGMMGSQEYGRLQLDIDSDACLDDPYFGYGLAPSVAAGRLSYQFDLHGPSMCVDTACSSSLLGVHLAAESLRSGECDLAVAGGVSALLHPAAMVQACRAHMLAEDGRCKTFDAAADGFLMAEGCGMVVLERVSDAVLNGHRVLAVIRGSAVGQDGRSNGMTAPNLAAQAQVVTDALAAAGVRPGQVGYVETHGSGTKLGDAVEVAALQQVFGAERDPDAPLVLGAVKTHIGHLLGAAGIAGLVKAVLVLRHGTIPANLHLSTPNSAVDWSVCPMLLGQTETAWRADGEPRIAGVSSFGWSGTNVHLVVQESERMSPPAGRSGPAQLLRLSAATPSALVRVAKELHGELAWRKDVELADVAHTLRHGRAELAYRAPLVCRDLPDALSALRDLTESAACRAPAGGTGTVFLFPGTGDHYPGMGRELYEREPAFHDAFDECAELLRPLLGVDLRVSEYAGSPAANRRPAGDLATLLGRSAAAVPAEQPEFVHGRVFAVEYALARLWQRKGVRPDAMLGYSLGEYVAACVAGVFSLPDVLRVVALRAKLIGALPEGAMLAVPLPAEALEQILPTGVSVAAHNGPNMTVVAGSLNAMRHMERALDARDVMYRRVNNGHALHTAALDPIRAEVAGLVAAARPGTPDIDIVSSQTGTWLTAEQATDPGYWAAQMCEPVRFECGLRSLAERVTGIALELGPGQTLSSLAAPILGGEPVLTPVPTLRPAHIDCGDQEYVLRATGRHWALGGRSDAEPVPVTGRSVSLPTYPFEHRRFWPTSGHSGHSNSISGSDSAKLIDRATWCHLPVWKQSLCPQRSVRQQPTGWLVFNGGDEVLDEFFDDFLPVLREAASEVIRVVPGHVFRRLADDVYAIDPSDPGDYRRLFDQLHQHGTLPRRILHSWSGSSSDGQTVEPRFLGLLPLAAELGRHAADARLHVLSIGAQDVLPGESADPWQATAQGLTCTMHQEYPGVRCRSIDLSATDVAGRAPEVRDALLAELLADVDDSPVAHRGTRRWVRAWEPVPVEQAGTDRVWRAGGVYLITGGFGELGTALARDLAKRLRPKLALLGRSAPPTDVIRGLEELGAEVLPISADVTDPAQVTDALNRIRQRFGALHGVVHAAGLPARGLITLKTRQDAEHVFQPKIGGAVTLAKALRSEPLDFLVFYSSSVVAFGGVGESDYCAANAFLDAFAHRLRGQGIPATAVDWGPWRRDAWTKANGDPMWLRLRELRDRYGIGDDEGFDMLTRVIAAELPEVLVVPQEPEVIVARWTELMAPTTAAADGEGHPRPQLRTPYVAPRNGLERQISEVWRQYLGVDRVGVDDQFFELGGNSLIGLTIVARLAKELDVQLSAADLFEAPTPAAVAEVVATRLGGGGDGEEPNSTHGSRRGEQRRRLAAAAARRRAGASRGGADG